MYCGKCGKEVPEGFEYCMHCGTKIIKEDNANLEKNDLKRKSRIKIILLLSFLLVLAGGVIGVLMHNKKNSKYSEKMGYYANIPWGVNEDEFKKEIKNLFRDKILDDFNVNDLGEVWCIVQNYDDMDGVNVSISGSFKNDGLVKVYLLYMIENDKEYNIDSLEEKYEKKFEGLFGKGNRVMESLTKWKTPSGEVTMFKSTKSVSLSYEKSKENIK